MEERCVGENCLLWETADALNRGLLAALHMRMYEDRNVAGGKTCLHYDEGCPDFTWIKWTGQFADFFVDRYNWLSERLCRHRCVTSLSLGSSLPDAGWVNRMSWITTLTMNMDPIPTWVDSWPECLRTLEMTYHYYDSMRYYGTHAPLPASLTDLTVHDPFEPWHVPPLSEVSHLRSLNLQFIRYWTAQSVIEEVGALVLTGIPNWFQSVERLTVIGLTDLAQLAPFAAAPRVVELKIGTIYGGDTSEVIAVANNVRSSRLKKITLTHGPPDGVPHPHPFRLTWPEGAEEESDAQEMTMVDHVLDRVRSVSGYNAAVHIQVRCLANALPAVCVAAADDDVWARQPPADHRIAKPDGDEESTETTESVALNEMTTAFRCLPLVNILFRSKDIATSFEFPQKGGKYVCVSVFVNQRTMPSLTVGEHMDCLVDHPTLRAISANVTRHPNVLCSRCGGPSFEPLESEKTCRERTRRPAYKPPKMASYHCGWHEFILRMVAANSPVLSDIYVWCEQLDRDADRSRPPAVTYKSDPGFVTSLAPALCKNNRLERFVAPMSLHPDNELDMLSVFRENGTISRFGTVTFDAYEGDLTAFGTECMRSNRRMKSVLMHSSSSDRRSDVSAMLPMVERNAAYLNRAEEVVRAVRSAKTAEDKENVLNALADARKLGCMHRVTKDELLDRVGDAAAEGVHAAYNYIVDRFLQLTGVCAACPPIKDDSSKCGLSDLTKDCIDAILSMLRIHDVIGSSASEE